MSANFVGNTLTQSEANETYTPYDVTSSRPRKTKIAFFANFGGIEKLFCAPEQSMNSKIMNQSNIDFNFLEQKRGLKFHFIGTLREDGKEIKERYLERISRLGGTLNRAPSKQ